LCLHTEGNLILSDRRILTRESSFKMRKVHIATLLVSFSLISSSLAFALREARDTSSSSHEGSQSGNHSIIKVNPHSLKNAPVQGRALGLAIAVTTLLAALNVIPIATLTIAFYAVSYLMKGVTTAYRPSWMEHSSEDSSSSLDYLSKLLPQGASYDENVSGPFSLDIETDGCRMQAICQASSSLGSALPSFVTSPINSAKGILSSYLSRASPELDAVINGVGRNCKTYSYNCNQSKGSSSNKKSNRKRNKGETTTTESSEDSNDY